MGPTSPSAWSDDKAGGSGGNDGNDGSDDVSAQGAGRIKLSNAQLRVLEAWFKLGPYLKNDAVETLSMLLNLHHKVINAWFQAARQKQKSKNGENNPRRAEEANTIPEPDVKENGEKGLEGRTERK